MVNSDDMDTFEAGQWTVVYSCRLLWWGCDQYRGLHDMGCFHCSAASKRVMQVFGQNTKNSFQYADQSIEFALLKLYLEKNRMEMPLIGTIVGSLSIIISLVTFCTTPHWHTVQPYFCNISVDVFHSCFERCFIFYALTSPVHQGAPEKGSLVLPSTPTVSPPWVAHSRSL